MTNDALVELATFKSALIVLLSLTTTPALMLAAEINPLPVRVTVFPSTGFDGETLVIDVDAEADFSTEISVFGSSILQAVKSNAPISANICAKDLRRVPSILTD